MKYLSILFFLFSYTCQAQNWGMVWREEFNYAGLPNDSLWSYDVGGDGWGNQELQYYTSERTENARVENGNLIIEARKEPFGTNQYTSARLTTKNKIDWKYGRLEVRAQIPSGTGVWPAIWLLPTEKKYGAWPASGEIDLMENVGFEPGKVHFNIHTDAYNHVKGTNKGSEAILDAPESTFHTYILEWYPDSLVFKVDEKKYFTFKKESDDYKVWPYNEHFYLILNTAIGGEWGGQQGIDNTIFPQQFLIDYVRLYKLQSKSAPYTVSATSSGGGLVQINPAQNNFADSAAVTISAVPDPNYRFLKWSGDFIGTKNPLKFNIRSNISVNAEFIDATKMVVNGDFDKGLEAWSFNSGNGNSISSSGGQGCITVTDPGTNPWDVSLTQEGIKLESGKKYILSFRASASQAKTINAGIGMSVSPWDTYLYQPTALDASTQTFSYALTAPVDDENARIIFDVGKQAGNVCIDAVSLKEATMAGITAKSDCFLKKTGTTFIAECPSFGNIQKIRVLTADGREIARYKGAEAIPLEALKKKNAFLLQIFTEDGRITGKKL